MTIKILFFTIVSVVINPACKKNDMTHRSAVIDFSKEYSISSNFNERSSILTIEVKLNKNIHAYAAGEKIGKPVSLDISSKNGWETIGAPDIPLGRAKELAGLGKSQILEGSFTIVQKLKKGAGPGEAVLHLQVCAENSCDRPRTHRFILK